MAIPEIAIIIPLFNRPRTLSRIIAALAGQTIGAGRFETLFIDDSGPDSYAVQRAIVEAAPAGIAPRYLTTGLPREVNGVSVARNRGIRAARAELVVFMDDDCIPHTALLEAHLRALRSTERIFAVGNRSEDESILGATGRIPVTSAKCLRELGRHMEGTLGSGSFVTANASARKADIIAAGLFDESFARAGEYGYEDRDLGDRLVARGLQLIFVQDAAVWNAPKESDPWKDDRHAAKEKGRGRYKAKHGGMLKNLKRSIQKRLPRRRL